MHNRSVVNINPSRFMGHVVAAGLVVYLLYHAFEGERGLYRWFSLKQEIRETNVIAEQIATEKLKLQNKVTRLSPETLDLDLLEEQVRKVLNFIAPNELIIINSPNP